MSIVFLKPHSYNDYHYTVQNVGDETFEVDRGGIYYNNTFPKSSTEVVPGLSLYAIKKDGVLNITYPLENSRYYEDNFKSNYVSDLFKVEILSKPEQLMCKIILLSDSYKDVTYEELDSLNVASEYIFLDSENGPYETKEAYTKRTSLIPRNERLSYPNYSYYGYREFPKLYSEKTQPVYTVRLRITDLDTGESKEGDFRFLRPKHAVIDLEKSSERALHLTTDFCGLKIESKKRVSGESPLTQLLKIVPSEQKEIVWKYFLSQLTLTPPNDSVKLLEVKYKDILSTLEKDEPTLYKFYLWLHSNVTVEGSTNNKLLAAMLTQVNGSYPDLVKSLRDCLKGEPKKGSYKTPLTRGYCLTLSGADEKERQRREKKEWNLRKDLSGKADGLGIDSIKYPNLFKYVEDSKIPLNIFHEPGDELKLINVEFSLWEKALARKGWGDVLSKICLDASRRSTYTRKITPYLSFLFKMESYMNTLTKSKGWKSFPSYVESAWQLEMGEADQQTSKRRSAFTPIADNEKKVLTIPYAAIAMHGRQTTYCYSEYYYVFEDNMVDEEGLGCVVNTLEEKLNGKDDYGLMYFTLTGTPRNQGYPTFLIIRENRKNGPFIHFHRVHPNRYKDGRPTPTCRLVEECYRYMAGNIRAEEVYKQQGDLIFIKSDLPKNSKDPQTVKGYENHTFSLPVVMYTSVSKSDKTKLGYVVCDSNMELQHPEHDWITLEKGIYEIRRCRSWEANPVSVWSINID